MTGLADLKHAVERLHECTAEHSGSSPVEEVFQGQTVWKGQVEIFELHGHPRASRCYAWSHETDDGGTRYQAVLELPPVNSPETAVRVAIAADYRRGEKET